MGEDEADQQRLLLAGRGRRGRHVLGAVAHDEVGGLRADKGAPGGAVAGAAVAQERAVAVLRVDGRQGRRRARRSRPRGRASRTGKGEASSRVARIRRGEALDRLAPGRRDRDAELGDLALDRVEPGRVVGALLEDAVARAQGPFESVDARAVLGVDREHEPVEEAAAVAGGAAEKSRRDRASARRPADGRRRPGASRPAAPSMRQSRDARPSPRRRLEAGAEAMLAIRVVERDRDGEGAGAAVPRHLGELGAAQAAARREQRQRFEEVGLAGAVLADERDERPRDRKIERRIGAEILKDEARGRGVRRRRPTDLPSPAHSPPITPASASARRAPARPRGPGSRSASRDRRA